MNIQFRTTLSIIGVLLFLVCGFLIIPILVSLFYEESVLPFVYSIIASAIIGALLFLLRPKDSNVGRKEGFLIVTLGWLALCFACALPYEFTNVTKHFTDSFFESTSGLTTTGATIFTDIESLPKGILMWRSLTQWIGGMGIIVLTVAILPMLGVSGVELFVAEAPGPQSEKIHPRIKETAKRLWLIYLLLSVVLCFLLWISSEMNFFDALNHALTTMSTGGFSTKNASMAHFGSVAQYLVMAFMFVAGMNYTLLYFGMKLRLNKLWASNEFKTYLFCVLFAIIACTIVLKITSAYNVEESFRYAGFQILTLVTTTGFITADYLQWNEGIIMFFFFLLFTGACAGSTSGGIKVVRHFVFIKNSYYEFRRLLHPNAIIRIKVDNNLVTNRIITHILVFLWIYFFLFLMGTVVMAMILSHQEKSVLTAFGSVATSLGNVGPAIGTVGPVDNFAHIPIAGKYLSAFLMIIGRLELFTVLILFTPYFWRDT